MGVVLFVRLSRCSVSLVLFWLLLMIVMCWLVSVGCMV